MVIRSTSAAIIVVRDVNATDRSHNILIVFVLAIILNKRPSSS